MKQKTFPGMRPPRPTIRTRRVAERVAVRLVEAVNLDEFYWTREELPERIADVTEEIMRLGFPAAVFKRLHKQERNRLGDGGHNYGWEGIHEHCGVIADDIACEELERAFVEWDRDYAP